ncbi:transporter substrate-binding domain-containing protein [uncultured Acinetobacter sp.]|uniref:transporter substrate-binding domain-containing protein n=1 Tax=uncultured Acinetobacter sp. TaxID=165433 RepID=UPI002585EE8E|nr:transporter substrate-binding domain-containing protein [uncultured Acinetobacter sp.]
MSNRTSFVFALTTLSAVLVSSFAHADALADIKKAGVIKIAIPQDFPPFGTVGTDLKAQGYDIDVAKLIAQDLGVKLQLVPVTSANRIPYLTTKKVDLVISSLGKNPEREKVIDFAGPYAPFYNGVFGQKNIAVKSAADLAGKTIAVTRGSIEDLELSKVAPNSTTIKRFEDNNSTVSAFYSGQVNLIATGNVVAGSLSKHFSKKPLDTKFIIKNSPCYIGLNKGEAALQGKLNAIIKTAKSNGQLNRISVQWLGAPLPKQL